MEEVKCPHCGALKEYTHGICVTCAKFPPMSKKLITATKTTLHNKEAITLDNCYIYHTNRYKGVVRSYDVSLCNAMLRENFPASTMQYNKDGTITFQLWIFKKKFPNIEIQYIK